MAEGVLRSLLAGSATADVHIDSAGTHDYHAGEPPFAMAVEAARRRGYEIAGQTARRIRPDDFDHFDFIVAMDRANIAALRAICPTRCKSKLELLGEYADAHHGKEVPDPYGKTPRDFELALDIIEEGCKGLAQVLRRHARPGGGDGTGARV